MKRLATTLLACTLASAAQAHTPGHITGIGGIFVQSSNPKALAA